MTREQKLAALKAWQERMQACESATDDLIRLTAAAPESPLIDAIYNATARLRRSFRTAIARPSTLRRSGAARLAK